MSTAPLWTSSAMAAAMRASVQGTMPTAISGLSIDSRTVAPGEAYFAIKGGVHDEIGRASCRERVSSPV